MRLYFLSGMGRLHVGEGILWNWVCNNIPNVPVYVHSDIDYHWLRGECLLRNMVVNLIKLEPWDRVSDVSGPCYFLAVNGHRAEKMLYKTK